MRRVVIAPDELGPAMAGLPALQIAPDVMQAHGVRYSPAKGSRARLWWRRGADSWQGPFPHWRGCMEALRAAGGPVDRLAHGRASPLGASAISRGWRWRLAWGGATPPERYG